MMKKQTASEPGVPFSLEGFLTVAQGKTLTEKTLQRLNLSTLGADETLRVSTDWLTVQIHRDDDVLRVRLVYQVNDEHPWAKIYGTEAMARAMCEAALDPLTEFKPEIIATAWVRPNTVAWEFVLPLGMTGRALIKAVVTSMNWVKTMALSLLRRRFPKTDEVTRSTDSVPVETTKGK